MATQSIPGTQWYTIHAITAGCQGFEQRGANISITDNQDWVPMSGTAAVLVYKGQVYASLETLNFFGDRMWLNRGTPVVKLGRKNYIMVTEEVFAEMETVLAYEDRSVTERIVAQRNRNIADFLMDLATR